MKTIVITGATSGIGYAVCRAFAGMGWAVLGVGRSQATCDTAAAKLKAEFPQGDITFYPCDLSKQAEIVRLGDAISQTLADRFGGELDVLVNNAGCVRSYYTTTEDGMETVLAVNHLAAFQLTNALMPALLQAQGRMLITSSQSHKYTRMHWNDLMLTGGYRPLLAYKQSKLANLLLAHACNRRYGAQGVHCYGIDPGLVNTDIGEKNTSGLVRLFWHWRKGSGVAPDKAAKSYVYAATTENTSALYIGQQKPKRCSWQVNEENAEHLWTISAQLCGLAP